MYIMFIFMLPTSYTNTVYYIVHFFFERAISLKLEVKEYIKF